MRSGVGVTVRAGAPKPDISTADAVKRAVLAAKSVGISTGPSGVYMSGLFERMGIAAELKPKLKVPPSGTQIAELVAKGEIELGFQQVSEIVHVKGAQYVGPLPAEIQRITVFGGAVHAASQEPDAALALLEFLASPEHAACPSDSSTFAASTQVRARCGFVPCRPFSYPRLGTTNCSNTRGGCSSLCLNIATFRFAAPPSGTRRARAGSRSRTWPGWRTPSGSCRRSSTT